MSSYDYDLFVIGAGSGGVRTARMAAAQGVKVAIAEQGKIGGTCVNLGCVPKKIYVHAAEFAIDFIQAAGFGWQSSRPGFNWSILRDNKSTVIADANLRLEAMLDKAGAQLIRGRARLVGPHEIEIAGKIFTSERILIATGSRPYLPDIPGKEHLLSSDRIFDLPKLPKSILIVGGGYIASEFAGIFNGLGVAVTQIYRGSLFLRGFDQEIRKYVADQMREKGIDLRFNCDLLRIEKETGSTFTAVFADGTRHTTELVLAATGRHPNSEGLGLAEIGVELTDTNAVKVDDCYQTTVPSIYALGDVIDRMQLTPVALAEAMTLIKNLYLDKTEPLSYSLIPTAVFSQPNIGCVGLTEEEAITRYPQVDVYTAEFLPLKYSLSGRDERILMKLIVDKNTDRVIGAHMAGEGAGETIQGIAVALKAGATKTIFDQTVGIHPTNAEEFVTMRTTTRHHGY